MSVACATAPSASNQVFLSYIQQPNQRKQSTMTDTTTPSGSSDNFASSPVPAPKQVDAPPVAYQPDQNQPVGYQQPQPVYQQPQYAPAPVFVQQVQPVYIVKPAPSKKGFGVTSMVLGISAVIFAWTAVFAFVLLVCAIVFGFVSLKRRETPRGFAITGIVLGSFAVLLVIIIIAVLAMLAAAVGTVGVVGY